MANAWGVSWGTSWGVSWGSGVTPPVTIPVSGGSGNRSHGSGRRRNINDDPDAFAELLKEWREKRTPAEAVPVVVPEKDTHPEPVGPVETFGPLDELRQAEVSYDRAMAAYEAALLKVEQTKVKKAEKARNAAIWQEEQARQQAIQLAIEWELARLAYEDFLDDEDDVMLLTAA